MSVKEERNSIAENLHQDATWDDVLYEIQVLKKNDLGLKAAKEGRTASHDTVKGMFRR